MSLILLTRGLQTDRVHWFDNRTLWVTEGQVAEAKVLKNQFSRYQIPEMNEELWKAKKSKHPKAYESSLMTSSS